jgi:hypothetical protein
MPNFGKISAAQVVLEFLLSTAGAGPSPTYEVKITLRGVNRRQACDADTPQISEVSTAPSVKRAV